MTGGSRTRSRPTEAARHPRVQGGGKDGAGIPSGGDNDDEARERCAEIARGVRRKRIRRPPGRSSSSALA
jgi:hypothetical protein